jgi:hypothetical protein
MSGKTNYHRIYIDEKEKIAICIIIVMKLELLTRKENCRTCRGQPGWKIYL